jgi:2-methylisocitrate lyase-like PEP mutase family enzyme
MPIESLRRMLAAGLVIAPGVYDGLSALIAEQSGARALYLTGAGIALTRYGRPDLGLVDMTEVAAILAAIRDRVGLPIIADGDNGFGNALNVQRTVRTFERSGATAIQLEDQTLPKRCGHLAGKSLVSAAEMVGKVKAACDARTSEEFLIIARTDAVAVEGFERAIARAHAYVDAGADVTFVEAVRTREEMEITMAELGPRAPQMINLIEGGRTPMPSREELQAIGFRLAIFPNSATRAAAFQLQALYETLVRTGSTGAMRDRMLDFAGINDVVGTDALLKHGARYAEGQAGAETSVLPSESERQFAR